MSDRPSTRRVVKVFLASPGDLLDEREIFFETCRALTAASDVLFEPLGWEKLLASTGPRPQDLINQLVDRCDVFVLAMWRRWGQETADAAPATSYTEEEFQRAIARLADSGSPEIFCFFKDVEPDLMADPGEQLKKVLRLRESLETSRQVLYGTFPDVAAFAEQLREHLRAYAEGRLASTQRGPRPVHISVPEDRQPRSDEEVHALGLMKQAVNAASAGRAEAAIQLLARVVPLTTDVVLLDVVHQLAGALGQSTLAQRAVERRAALTRDREAAARLYMSVMPSMTESTIEWARPSMSPEELEMFASTLREVWDTPESNEQLVEDFARHLSVHELLLMARFYGGEGRSITEKMGRFMGECIPRRINEVNDALRRKGFDV
jgi:hypothetical protein